MTTKMTEKMLFSPSFEYVDNGIEHGVLSPFETKEIILEKGSQIAEGFKPLDCAIKMLKDVPVQMRDGITIYTDIYLPITEEKVPVLVAWSPYGKSAGTAPRYKNLFQMLGMETLGILVLLNSKHLIQHIGALMDMLFVTQICAELLIVKVTQL